MHVIHMCIHIIIVVMFDMLMWTIFASQGGVTWSVSHWSQIKNCVQGPPQGGC